MYIILLSPDHRTVPYYLDSSKRALVPQRRGSLKNLTEGSHLFECSLSFNLLISKIFPPTTQTSRCLIVWVWWGCGWGCGWVWGVFTFRNIFASKSRVFFFLFFNYCYPYRTLFFGVPRMPYTEKNPQDFDQ